MTGISEAPYGARIYFLPAGVIFVRQTKLSGLIYQCDGWRGGTCKPGKDQADCVLELIELAREGKLPEFDATEYLRRESSD